MRCAVLFLASLCFLAPGPAAAEKSAVLRLGSHAAPVPEDWKETRPSSRMRLRQFALPRAKGDERDAELAVFYFEGGGGSAEDNVERWKSLFEPPRGQSIDDVTEVRKFKVRGARVTVVDVRGTYLHKRAPLDPDEAAERRPGHRLLGVVFETRKKGPYFLRLVGPRKTMAKHASDFIAWIKSFR